MKLFTSIHATDFVVPVLPVLAGVYFFPMMTQQGATVAYALMVLGLWRGRSSAMVS